MSVYNINDVVYSEISRSICTIIWVGTIQGEAHYRLRDGLGRTHTVTSEYLSEVKELRK